MTIEFRKMDIDDYQNVIDLWHTTENLGLSTADQKYEIEMFLTRNPGLCFVAVEDGKIIGAVLAGHDGRRGAIYHLAVQKNKRNRGVGSQLVKHCLHGLKIAGIERCHIHVYAKNQSGLAFWQKEGWYLRSELALLSIDIT
jgi:putative acetyltransferase